MNTGQETEGATFEFVPSMVCLLQINVGDWDHPGLIGICQGTEESTVNPGHFSTVTVGEAEG